MADSYPGPERRKSSRPPKPADQQRTVRTWTLLRPRDAKAFRETTESEGQTQSHVLRQLIRQWLKTRGVIV